MIRRGTANILVTLNGPTVTERFRILTARCDVLALQEWPVHRDGLTHRAKGWTFRRASLGGGPIGIRDHLGERVISCRAVMLTGPGYVGRIPGRKSVLGPSWATRLKTRRSDGRIVIRYNVHLTASVQVGKHGYRTDKAHALRVARHKRERASLERRVARDQAKFGRDAVEVMGDPNYHHMPIAGLVGWWSVEPDAGTLGDRAIDGIWTSRKPDTVSFLPALIRGEHRHVVASWT